VDVNESKDKPRNGIFGLFRKKNTSEETKIVNPPVELKSALPELGTAPCPVCGHRVTVFVTRTKRPFINCGFCSARIFYNGRESMRRLAKVTKPVND
jgi:DNA-directed RNA polymerase subunit RPC12/RpoP